MSSIPISQLYSGDSTPKLVKPSLLQTVQAVNNLFSFLDPDTDTTKLAVSRNVYITGDLNVSGNLVGNVAAASAAKLTTARTISITGDLAYTSAAFDGSANVTGVATLATVNSSPGTFGTASSIPVFVVNGKGLVTSVTNTSIAIAASQVTSGTFADARVAQSTVTQYQSALSITESQIPVGTLLARLGVNQTITGNWTHTGTVIVPTPSATGSATNKTYVDGLFTTATTTFVAKAGDVMTGALNIGNPNVFGGLLEISGSSNTYALIQRYSADIIAPQINFIKSRGTTATAKTAVAALDNVGSIFFQGMDGTTNQAGAVITAIIESTVSSGVVPTCLTFQTSATNTVGLTERMRIASNGYVSIGSTSAVRPLHIAGAGTGDGSSVTQVTIRSTNAYNTSPTAGLHFGGIYKSDGSSFGMAAVTAYKENATDGDTATSIGFHTRSSGNPGIILQKMVLDSTGKLSITSANTATYGTTTYDSAEFFSITNSNVSTASGAGANDPRLLSIGGYSNGLAIIRNESFGGIAFVIANTETLRIAANLNVGIGTSTPASKLTVVGNISAGSSGGGYDVIDVSSTNGVDVRLQAQGSTNIGSLGTQSNHPFYLYTNNLERMRIDSAGNLGFGITPFAWASSQKAIDINLYSYLRSDINGTAIGYNGYFNTSNQWTAKKTAGAVDFLTQSDRVQIAFAPSVAAGSTLAFTTSTTFTANGSVINNAGIGYSFVSANAGTTASYLICTLPASTFGTFDQATLICNFNDNWNSGNNRTARIMFANRNGFTARFLSHEGGAQTPASKIQAYTQSDGTTQIYAVLTNGYFGTLSVDVRTSIQVVLVPNPSAITTAPPGTLAFDTYTTPVVLATDGNGNFTVSGTITSQNNTASVNLFSATSTSTSFTGINYSSNSSTSASTNWRHIYCVSSANTVVNAQMFGNGNWQNANNSYSGTSDIKLKQDIVDANSQWNDIKAIRVRKYRFKNNPDGPLQIGVIAQEIELTSPGLVETTKDQDSEEETKAVTYSVLYMKAVKALQEAQTRIETLEESVASQALQIQQILIMLQSK